MKLRDMKVGVKFVRINKLNDECKSESIDVIISMEENKDIEIVPWMRAAIADKVKKLANENEVCIPYHLWYNGDGI